MINMKNRILAILAAPAATPPKPKIAAMIAIIKKTAAHPSMFSPHSHIEYEYRQPYIDNILL
jgi:hypothetical protein